MNFSLPVLVSTDGHVATVLLWRTPHNFVDVASMNALTDTLDAGNTDDNCHVAVQGSQRKSFCAGADFSAVRGGYVRMPMLCGQGMRLSRTRKPIVAAVHRPAIGAGLALMVDFRIACPASRLSVPLNLLGFHPASA